MKLNDYIKHYEEELEKLENHRMALLEYDKNTRYTESKIIFIENLLSILRNCKKTETLNEENSRYKLLIYKLERFFDKAKKEKDNKAKIEEETAELFKTLKEEVEEMGFINSK